MKTRTFWILGGLLVVVALVTAAVFPTLQANRTQAEPGQTTGAVTTLTAVSSIESTGAVEALQSDSLFWKTTGNVAMVNVKEGDTVKAGEVLMTVDPATAPQNVILAQSDFINAQNALDELLNPADTAIANAQKAVADAEEALDKARDDLKSVENPAGESLYEAVDDAKLALEQAQANQQLATVGSEATSLITTQDELNKALTNMQTIQAKYDDCVTYSCAERAIIENQLTAARNRYQLAEDAYNTARLRYDTATSQQDSNVTKAQEKYDDAVANLNYALAGPDKLKLATAQAKLAVAEANLADAQKKLDELLNGADADDIASAQARVLAAQATMDSLTLKAPFDGEVLAVNYQPGDSISQTQAAVVLANRSRLHVNVSVDETDVSQLAVGEPATITLDSLPDLTLSGEVSQISRYGATVQGLVKYTVRVDLAEADPQVLIGMTASVNIITDTDDGALAVPLDAVQLDADGEFVNRLQADGAFERVNVVSGEVQDDMVIVSGPLQPGETVQIIIPQPAGTRGGLFGG